MAESATTGPSTWTEQLDQLTKDREGQDVTIEVLGQTIGDEREAEHLPFSYTTYDQKDDVVIVAVGGRGRKYPVMLRHMVWHPNEVDVDPAVGAFRVAEQDGTTTIVSFFEAAAE